MPAARSIAGHDVVDDPQAVRGVIGVTGQFAAVDGLLTGAENLTLMADLRHLGRSDGRRRVAELLEQFDLVEAATQPLATYSGGMRRRLDLAMTLVGDPRIIFLDEPTTGLDPRSRRTMWQIIRGLVADGVTIFLTTQYLEEADQLADRIAVLDGGRLIAEGTASELKRMVPGGHIRLQFTDPVGFGAAVRTLADATPDDAALTLQVPSDGGLRSIRALLDQLDTRRDRGRRALDPHPGSRRRLLRPHDQARPAGGNPVMTTLTHTLSDSATMFRRDLRHQLRYPSLTVMLMGMPLVFLLLFVYVFGGTLGAGLGDASGGRAEYLEYVVPGILLMAVAAVAQGTAISVAMDMTEGIVARFRTMAISRAAVLSGHVGGAMVQTVLGVAVVTGVAVAIGFRPVCRRRRVAGGVRHARADRVRAHLVDRRAGHGGQDRRVRQQPAHAADPVALPQQWVRPHRVPADRCALVRRAPAVHPVHRDAPGTPHGHVHRQQRHHLHRMVRRHLPGLLPLGSRSVRTTIGAMTSTSLGSLDPGTSSRPAAATPLRYRPGRRRRRRGSSGRSARGRSSA